jgi:c-di-AMP phosphodiesterase-like protein
VISTLITNPIGNGWFAWHCLQQSVKNRLRNEVKQLQVNNAYITTQFIHDHYKTRATSNKNLLFVNVQNKHATGRTAQHSRKVMKYG